MSALTGEVSKCPFADGPAMDIVGQRDGSLHMGEKSLGQRVEGRQADSQDLGSRCEEAAMKDLLLSGSWRARTIRTANRDPSMVAGLSCRLLPPQNRRGIRLEPKEGQVRKSQVGTTERVKPESRDPPPKGASEGLRPPSKVTQQDSPQSRAGMGASEVLV